MRFRHAGCAVALLFGVAACDALPYAPKWNVDVFFPIKYPDVQLSQVAAVVPPFTATMTASDFSGSFGSALSGSTLIRLPTPRHKRLSTAGALSGYLGFLSLRAAALYTVPAARGSIRFNPRRGRLRLQGTGSPREKVQLHRVASWWG